MGILINSANSMKTLLANCTKFQQFVGAANANEALALIYTDPVFLNKELIAADKYAVVVPNVLEMEIARTGVGCSAYNTTQSNYVNIIGSYAKQDSNNSQAFLTFMDELLEEILEKQSNGYKDISFLKKLTNIPYMWTLSNEDEQSSFSDLKRGFQIAFEEGAVLE